MAGFRGNPVKVRGSIMKFRGNLVEGYSGGGRGV